MQQSRITKPSTPDEEALRGVEESVQAAFFPILAQFSIREKALLTQSLSDLMPVVFLLPCALQTLTTQRDASVLTLETHSSQRASNFKDTIKNVEGSVPSIFLEAEKAVEHCMQLTSGTEAEGLVRVLSVSISFSLFLSFLSPSIRFFVARPLQERIQTLDNTGLLPGLHKNPV